MAEKSLPVRERGLKRALGITDEEPAKVAPRAGAWIEAPTRSLTPWCWPSRSPCGSVD